MPAAATRPTSRVLTDQTWADVVVDLRHDRTGPLPTRPFAGRRKIETEHGLISGTLRGEGMQILKWTDATGFTGAIVGTNSEGAPYAEEPLTPSDVGYVLSHARLLVSEAQRPRPHLRRDLARVERGEAIFGRSMAALRTVLTSADLEARVPGADSLRQSLIFRLGWAGVGVADLRDVPQFLRDWERSSTPHLAQDRAADRDWFPEILTLSGPHFVAAWQRAGFDDVDTITDWAQSRYGTFVAAENVTRTHRIEVDIRAEWHDAGYNPTEFDTWFSASRFDTNGFTPRYIKPDKVRSLAASGMTPQVLSRLTATVEDTTAPGAVYSHVTRWARVSPDLDRVCAYIEARVGMDEAKRMERSDPPSLEQLRLLGALNRDQPR